MSKTYDYTLKHEQAHQKVAQQLLKPGFKDSNSFDIHVQESFFGFTGKFYFKESELDRYEFDGLSLHPTPLVDLAGVHFDLTHQGCDWDDEVQDIDFFLFEIVNNLAGSGSTDAKNFLDWIEYDEWEGTYAEDRSVVKAYLLAVSHLLSN